MPERFKIIEDKRLPDQFDIEATVQGCEFTAPCAGGERHRVSGSMCGRMTVYKSPRETAKQRVEELGGFEACVGSDDHFITVAYNQESSVKVTHKSAGVLRAQGAGGPYDLAVTTINSWCSQNCQAGVCMARRTTREVEKVRGQYDLH